MILETKRLWFKKAVFFLEDTIPPQDVLEKKYDSVNIISYEKLDLPGWRVREKDTALINLTLPEEEIFRKFNDTTRNEIRRTFEQDKLSFIIGKNSSALYHAYATFEKSQGRVPVSKKEMDTFISAEARSGNGIVYGLYIVESFPYIRIRSIFSKRSVNQDKEEIKLISNAGRRLIWETLKYTKNKGFKSFDMASVNQSNPKSANIAKFKLSFGGEVLKEYTYIYSSHLFLFFEENYKRILNLKQFFSKLF